MAALVPPFLRAFLPVVIGIALLLLFAGIGASLRSHFPSDFHYTFVLVIDSLANLFRDDNALSTGLIDYLKEYGELIISSDCFNYPSALW